MARRKTFWVKIDRIKSRWEDRAVFREYVLPAMRGQKVAVPRKMADAYNLLVDLENLYWEADYHGLDCANQSCSCKESTHQQRKFPSLWRRLEEIERGLNAISA